jgi:hypothetical protein
VDPHNFAAYLNREGYSPPRLFPPVNPDRFYRVRQDLRLLPRAADRSLTTGG